MTVPFVSVMRHARVDSPDSGSPCPPNAGCRKDGNGHHAVSCVSFVDTEPLTGGVRSTLNCSAPAPFSDAELSVATFA